MLNSICDVPGIKVGHAQDFEGGTGCTVVIPEKEAACGVNVAGGGPATRETDSLNPVNLIQHVHAVYFGGGSAYGLAGTDGVMKWCEENGRGYDVGVGIVPIVPSAVLFDLAFGSSKVRPDSAMGYRACENASCSENRMGNIGAGTGASCGKGRGKEGAMKSGIGSASIRIGDIIIGAIVAVNSFGDVMDPSTGRIIAGTRPESGDDFLGCVHYQKAKLTEGINPLSSNTTIGVIATNARLTKFEATKISMMVQDGFARAINPIHTMHDGDTVFTLSVGDISADITAIGSIAAELMSEAILNSVKHAKSAYGLPGLGG